MPCSRPVWLVAGVWLQGARYAGPCAAGAAVVTADHARQPAAAPRIRHCGGELAAQLADRELPASLARRRFENGPGDGWEAASRKALRQQWHQDRGRLGASRVRAAQAPGRADHFNLSLHRYVPYS
jgi:hypothetical protein